MNDGFLKKLIVALAVIFVLSLAAAIVLRLGFPEEKPSPGTETPATGPAVTDPSRTGATEPDSPETNPPVTYPPVTSPPVTNPPVTNPPVTNPPVTDPPPETEPPTPVAPTSFSFRQTYKTDSGTKLNLRAVCVGTRNADGTVSLSVELYLDHNSLYMGRRTGAKLTVGGHEETFAVEAIRQESYAASSTLIHSYTGRFTYGEKVDLYVRVPVRVTYGETYVEYLTVDESFTLR